MKEPQPKFACPNCAHRHARVIRLTIHPNGRIIRRQHECRECGQRFATVETIDSQPAAKKNRDISRAI